MRNFLKLASVLSVTAGLAACSMNAPRGTYNKINEEMAAVTKSSAGASGQPDAVANALLPPVSTLASSLPQARAVIEERFNVAFNNVPAQQFFVSLAAGTRYNMLVHPEVSGNITANLRDVTMVEALDAVRELYGYDYRIEGTRIYIRPLTIQSRMFQVNYLTAQRLGMSNLRVSSTSVADVSNNGNNNNNGNNGSNGNNNNQQNNNNQDNNNQGNNGQGGRLRDASNVMTRTESDFWKELKLSLETLVGGKEGGRSVVISPQSGVIVVRGMPDELRAVDRYLRATQLSVERQVILEAKILEVELNSGFQSGINWSAFGTGNNHRITGGVVQPGTGLGTLQTTDPVGNAVTGLVSSTGRNIVTATEAAGTLFGLAFQTSNFAALISFLESQGTVHVLSSPRITATNNQKAVLKIGTDEFFVTGVSTTTNTNAAGNGTVSPNVTLQPFFSGVVLDVTPQIDEHGNILMHVHPSVSQVSTVNKSVNLGTALGALNLPLASSTTSEFDSMVRGQDGKVVAIGGLMRQATTSDRSGVPGVGGLPVIGNLFSNRQEVMQKRELVVLIKPTVIEGDSSWGDDLLNAERRIKDLDPARRGGR